jgi:tetratricopeptide (TPR) repeat protein
MKFLKDHSIPGKMSISNPFVDLSRMLNPSQKRQLFLVFALLIFGIFLSAQQNIDSLKNALNESVLDTNRVKTLNRLSWNLRSIDPKIALAYALEAETLAEKIAFDKGKGDAYNNIGVIHYRRGEYVEATKAHLQALSIREKIGDKEGIALSEINLGNVFSDQNNNELALQHYLAAVKMLNEINNTKRLPIIYLNISAIFLAENKYDEALPYCEKARDGAIKNQDSVIIAEALNNMGVVFESKNNLDDAMSVYSQAFQISEKIGDKTEMVDNLINIGNIFRLKKSFDLAIEQHSKAEKIARENGYLEGLRVLYEGFSKDYQAMGKFEQALNYHIQFKQLSDSLFNDENTTRINALMEKWQTDRDEKELMAMQEELFQKKEADSNNEKRLWVFGCGGIIMLLFVGYVFYANARMKRANLLINAQAEEIARKKQA